MMIDLKYVFVDSNLTSNNNFDLTKILNNCCIENDLKSLIYPNKESKTIKDRKDIQKTTSANATQKRNQKRQHVEMKQLWKA